MSRKILVTGGAGFIGSFLVDELIRQGHDVTILDNLNTFSHPDDPGHINPKAMFLRQDILDYESLARSLPDFEVIFHNAALVGIAQSNYNIRQFVEVNTLGTANILNVLANCKHNVKKLIISASNTAYGEGMYTCSNCGAFHPRIRTEDDFRKHGLPVCCPKCGLAAQPIPTPEGTELMCNSIYAFTKRDQEDMFRHFGQMYGVPVTVLRYFNVYGPRQSLSNPYTGVMAIFMSRILNGNHPVIYEDGLQTRDFVSVHDVVQANILAMTKSAADNEVFNVASGVSRTVSEIADALIRLCGKDLKPEINDRFRKGDIRHCMADISKIRAKLGFEPSTGFDPGLKELLEWSRQQKSKDGFDKADKELKQKGMIL